MEKCDVKRVAALYRVSTKKQIDQRSGDIPMQKIACHEFAVEKGWAILYEFYEKGVSGFKVSANDRDAIQDLKEIAIKKEFDVLLVFMFDRLGRIDSETPFVVEWFVQHGIEVWSVKEGQQKLNDQADKLINYVRFWQANGESQKTSARVKTIMAQMTAAGIYHGGQVPFGYKLVQKGRMNKKNQPVKDMVIDHAEAEIVRMIFQKTVYEGYGSHRLAEYVNNIGIRTHNGSLFQSVTILRILRNRLYCGYYISGGTSSEKIEAWVIIDENTYDSANNILAQRSVKYEEKQHIARTTKGRTLLSGNIYCGHCGCRLNAASAVEHYVRKDGSVYEKEIVRYTCYHRARRLNDCDGQAVYIAEKIDTKVLKIVRSYLEKIVQTPKDKALELRYRDELTLKMKQRKSLEIEKARLEKRLHEVSVEIGKSLNGESAFTVDVLSMSVTSTKEELMNVEKQLADCDTQLKAKDAVLKKLDYYYEQFISWADEFENASLERKKMIICHLIQSIKVRKGYELEIEFNISYQQFFASERLKNDCNVS